MTAYQCSCGYAAASDGELGDHWGEAFIPADDRDASGVVHAETAREVAAKARAVIGITSPVADGSAATNDATSDDAHGTVLGPLAFACLCGAAFDVLAKLDEHLLSAFTPADRVGHDGRAHARAA
jgi:hypothetical protein